MDINSKMKSIMFVESWNIYVRMSSAMKQLLENFFFEFLYVFNFPCTSSKEASSCRFNIMTFRHSIAYTVDSFVALLDITVKINILQEIIKLLFEKSICIDSKTMHQTKENGHSNQAWINR